MNKNNLIVEDYAKIRKISIEQAKKEITIYESGEYWLINQNIKVDIPKKIICTKDIDRVLYRCNSYNRFETFLQMKEKLSGSLYWYAFRKAYEDSDNLYRFKDEIKKALKSKKWHRENLMTRQEKKFLNSLPDIINIYRGMTRDELKSSDFGVSWTLKKEIADFFSNNYQRNHDTNKSKRITCKLTIRKKDVIAFFNDRKEFEIIYFYAECHSF